MATIEIFYADDDIDDIEIFMEAVEHLIGIKAADIALKVFQDGKSLLKGLMEKPQSNPIVFLDINMPVKNGFDILQEIRNEAALKTLPVIMYSTSSDSLAIRRSLDMGASKYAIKPGDFNELKKIIQHVIGIDWKTFKTDLKNFVLGHR